MGIFKKIGKWGKAAAKRRRKKAKRDKFGTDNLGVLEREKSGFVTAPNTGGLPPEGLRFQEKKQSQVNNPPAMIAGMKIPKPVLYIVGGLVAVLVLVKTVLKPKRRRR